MNFRKFSKNYCVGIGVVDLFKIKTTSIKIVSHIKKSNLLNNHTYVTFDSFVPCDGLKYVREILSNLDLHTRLDKEVQIRLRRQCTIKKASHTCMTMDGMCLVYSGSFIYKRVENKMIPPLYKDFKRKIRNNTFSTYKDCIKFEFPIKGYVKAVESTVRNASNYEVFISSFSEYSKIPKRCLSFIIQDDTLLLYLSTTDYAYLGKRLSKFSPDLWSKTLQEMLIGYVPIKEVSVSEDWGDTRTSKVYSFTTEVDAEDVIEAQNDPEVLNKVCRKIKEHVVAKIFDPKCTSSKVNICIPQVFRSQGTFADTLAVKIEHRA